MCIATAWMGAAQASHYELPDVGRLTSAQVRLFHAQGIHTTEHVLKAALTPKARHKLAPQVGLTELELLAFVRECELLQIRGVGPTMARLLTEAGVTGVDDLGGRDAQNLYQRLSLVNEAQKIIGGGVPPEGLLYDWIRQARTVAYKVRLE
ncbi:MAG: DUF4332 domain-containing protein [Myxococcota bacterium]